jgi:alpha-beta hydrolase superfamily lysophospholipase
VARLEGMLRGKKTPSPLINMLSFGAFNNAFKPARTAFDWLSRDEKEVDKYVADPYCGAVFTTGFWYDMLTGINNLYAPGVLNKIPQHLPIYLFSCAKDPVGKDTKDVQLLYESYRTAGIKDVSVKFYEGGRHEMLNETSRQEVFADVIKWLDSHL